MVTCGRTPQGGRPSITTSKRDSSNRKLDCTSLPRLLLPRTRTAWWRGCPGAQPRPSLTDLLPNTPDLCLSLGRGCQTKGGRGNPPRLRGQGPSPVASLSGTALILPDDPPVQRPCPQRHLCCLTASRFCCAATWSRRVGAARRPLLTKLSKRDSSNRLLGRKPDQN